MGLLEELDQLWERFERHLEAIRGASRDTVASYRHTYRLYRRFVEETGVEELSTASVEEFMLWLHERGYSRSSIRRHYYALKSFILYTPYRDDVNWREIKPRVVDRIEYVILDEGEVAGLIRAAFSISRKHGLMLWLGYEIAARAGELVSLTAGQVDLGRRAIIKRPLKREQPCEAPIGERLAEELADWIESHALGPRDHLFTTRHGRPYRRDIFHRYIFRPAAERSGLLAKYPGLRYHDLRHSRATNLLRRGVDIYTVNRILCHKRLQTTMVYLHLARAEELRGRIYGAD